MITSMLLGTLGTIRSIVAYECPAYSSQRLEHTLFALIRYHHN